MWRPGQWSEPLEHRVHLAVSLTATRHCSTDILTQQLFPKLLKKTLIISPVSAQHRALVGSRETSVPSTCLWFQLHCHCIYLYVENRQTSKPYGSPHFSHLPPKSGFELQDRKLPACLYPLFLLPACSFSPLTPHSGWQAADTMSWTKAPTQQSHRLKILGQNSNTQRRWPRPPLVNLDSIQYSSFALPKYKENQDRCLQDADPQSTCWEQLTNKHVRPRHQKLHSYNNKKGCAGSHNNHRAWTIPEFASRLLL